MGTTRLGFLMRMASLESACSPQIKLFNVRIVLIKRSVSFESLKCVICQNVIKDHLVRNGIARFVNSANITNDNTF